MGDHAFDKEEKLGNDDLNRKMPFHDALIQNAAFFASETPSQTPEMESIGVVFSYVYRDLDQPNAIVRGQQGNLKNSRELSNMIYQLSKTQQNLIRQLENSVVGVDEVLRRKAELLVKLNAEIACAENQRRGD